MGNRNSYERVPAWYDPDAQPGDVANPDPEPVEPTPGRLQRCWAWVGERVSEWEEVQERVEAQRRREEAERRAREQERQQRVLRLLGLEPVPSRTPAQHRVLQTYRRNDVVRDARTGRYYHQKHVMQQNGRGRRLWVECAPPERR